MSLSKLSRFIPGISASPLSFVGGVTLLGPIQTAQGANGASYQHGPLVREMPACAWREPPEGGIQTIAIAATFEETKPAMQRIEAALFAGKTVHSAFWPIRAMRGGAYYVKKAPLLLQRDASGLSFEPLCLGTTAVKVPVTRLREFLKGERSPEFPNVPRQIMPSYYLMHERLLTLARNSGILSRTERFQAAIGITWTRCLQSRIDTMSLNKIRQALNTLEEGLAPLVEGQLADSKGLERAHGAIEALVASDLANKFGKAGNLFLTTEVGPLLALAEARKIMSRAPTNWANAAASEPADALVEIDI